MSDQTPPLDQPTPTPAGVGDGAGQGAPLPPPPPPPPPAGADYGSQFPPPPAPPKKSRTGLIIGVVAGLVVLAIVAVLAIVLVVKKGEDTHSISIPSTAGGMKHDTAKETELKQQLDAAEQQFKTQFKSPKNVNSLKSGVFHQKDAKRGPVGALVFLGAKVSLSDKAAKTNASDFIAILRKQATTNGFKVTSVATGESGGKAACAYQSTGQKVAICAWATNDSAGELIPTVPGYDAKQLSKILLDLRSDVEKTE